MTMQAGRVVRGVTAPLAVLSVAIGLWALVSPESFFSNVAPYPPYSRHLVHDLGAFQLGMGACLACGLLSRDALLAVLAGNAVGWIAHFISHFMDQSIGGHDTDAAFVGLAALLLTMLTLIRWLGIRSVRRTPDAPLGQGGMS